MATAPRVGADLCAARERLGWSLPAVASHLRIRLPYLTAIEEGRVRDLPGNSAYAVGFVRTYAQSLGLDPDEVARRFRLETADVNRKPELTFPAPVPERGVPAGAVVLVGAVLAIGAYVGWYHASGDGRSTLQPVTQVPARLAPLAEAPKPQPPPAPAAAPAAMPAASAEAPATPVVSPGSAAAAVTMPATPPVPAPIAAAAFPGSPPAAAPAQAAASPDPPQIVLRASADAWVQVRDRQGSVLLNRVMRAGDTWAVPAKGQLLLTTGNAGGTELLVDGVATPALGANGAVRRDLPLDAELIKEGRLSPPTQLGAAKLSPKQ